MVASSKKLIISYMNPIDLDDKISRQESTRLVKRRNSNDESLITSKKNLDVVKYENIFTTDLLHDIENSSDSEDPIEIDEDNITANADARSMPFSKITFSNHNTPEHFKRKQILLETKVVPSSQISLDDSMDITTV